MNTLLDKKIEIIRLEAKYLNLYSTHLVHLYDINKNGATIEKCFISIDYISKISAILMQIQIVKSQPIKPNVYFKGGGIVNPLYKNSGFQNESEGEYIIRNENYKSIFNNNKQKL